MAVPNIGNVTIISALFFLIFGIMAVNYFKGKYNMCEIDSTENIVTMFDCVNAGGHWTRSSAHFDNILASMLSLFELSTTEGWVSMMLQAMDSTEIGYEPIINNSWY